MRAGAAATQSARTAASSANAPWPEGSTRVITASPGANAVTPAPTVSTMPLSSLPATVGKSSGAMALKSPSRCIASTGLRPTARVRISTSPAAAVGAGTSVRAMASRPP